MQIPTELLNLGLIPALVVGIVALWRRLTEKDQQLLDAYSVALRSAEVAEAAADAIERLRTEMALRSATHESTPR